VVLQHLRRTKSEADAIVRAVESFVASRQTLSGGGSFPAFEEEASHGVLDGRWPAAQDLLFALHLLAEAVGASPILERTELITAKGLVVSPPPDAVALSLGSEFAPHFRHRETGWVVAFHGFRFGQFIGPGMVDWLRRDFERLPRTVTDVERDMAELASEVSARTGAFLLVQNLIASDVASRVANYAWLGDEFSSCIPVLSNEANLMLSGLTRRRSVSVIDSDALAAELGVHLCPDRFHAGRELLDAQRSEIHRVLREREVPGF
jgi:hypothetical protein